MSMMLKSPVDIEALRAYIQHARAEADRYEQVVHILTGKTNGNNPTVRKRTKEPSIADHVEALLLATGSPVSLAALIKALKTKHGIQVTPKNLANILNRWVNCDRPRFVRTAPNTFALKT